MSDWWSRRLSNAPQPAQRTAPQSTPPSSPPLRFPVQVPTTPQPVQHQQGRQQVLDENRAPTDNISMGDAIRLWKGGEAMRKEGNMSCPECGSPHVFGRSTRASNTTVGGKAPAPRCFECGWNGLYNQAIEGSWVS